MPTIGEAIENIKSISALEKVGKLGYSAVPVEHQAMYDTRYNTPKSEPSVEHEVIDKVIAETEIYRRAKLAILGDVHKKESTNRIKARDIILKAQQRQVGYGIEKYPEPLNPNTWSISETIGHIMDESIDKIHYLVMLLIKFEQSMVGKTSPKTFSILETIAEMIEDAIDELYSLVELNIELEREMEREPVEEKGLNTDGLDAMTHALNSMKWTAGADLDGDKVYVSADGKHTIHHKPLTTSYIDVDELLEQYEYGKLLSAEETITLKKAGLI